MKFLFAMDKTFVRAIIVCSRDWSKRVTRIIIGIIKSCESNIKGLLIRLIFKRTKRTKKKKRKKWQGKNQKCAVAKVFHKRGKLVGRVNAFLRVLVA